MYSFKLSICLAFTLLLNAGAARADMLFVGFNTSTPIQVYSTTGAYIQDIGPAGAIAAIPTASSYYFVQPGADLSESKITQYDPALSQIGSFTVNDLIDDGAAGANGLWLASNGGTVYQVSNTGTVATSWDTHHSHIGIAFDGTNIYTTEGDDGSNIDKWSTAGVLLGQIATPHVGLYGLGYDASSGDFWAGSTDFLYKLNGNGTVLSTLDLPGDLRTPNGSVHDSLNLGNVLPVVTTVPEPASLYMFGAGLLLLLGFSPLSRKLRRLGLGALVLACSAAAVFGSVNVTLNPSTNNAAAGTTILWTATASDTTNAGAAFT